MPPPRKAREFRTGDLVFAKIKGYPPWPARIEDLPSGLKPTPGRYNVFFFGTYETAVVGVKDLSPYEQYKHQFGIKRKMKNFNEGLEEIEKTPSLTIDTENLIKIREERSTQPMDSDNESHASDVSFQRSDDGNTSDSFSAKSASDSSNSEKHKNKKNGKSKRIVTKPNSKKRKEKESNDESDSDSDTEVKSEPKAKNNKNKSNGSQKENTNRKKNLSLKTFVEDKSKSKARKRIKISDSEASKSSIDDQSENESDTENNSSPKDVKMSIISDSEASKSPQIKSDSDHEKKSTPKDDNSDSQDNVIKKSAKRGRIDSDSDSDDNAKSAKSPKNDDNLEEVIKLKHKLDKEKLAQKLKEKEREKERRKREKMEQKRLERIRKAQEGDSIGGSSERTVGQILNSIDQSIKSRLSINNANIEKCLETMESINDLKITTQELSLYGKELIQTLRKCKKYKADQRIRDKAENCLANFKKLYTSESSKSDSPKLSAKTELESPLKLTPTDEVIDSNSNSNNLISTEEGLSPENESANISATMPEDFAEIEQNKESETSESPVNFDAPSLTSL